MMRQARIITMSKSLQDVLVLAFFIAALLFIAYPIIQNNQAPIASPEDSLHLKISTTNNEDTINESLQDPEIVSPIFEEN